MLNLSNAKTYAFLVKSYKKEKISIYLFALVISVTDVNYLVKIISNFVCVEDQNIFLKNMKSIDLILLC